MIQSAIESNLIWFGVLYNDERYEGLYEGAGEHLLDKKTTIQELERILHPIIDLSLESSINFEKYEKAVAKSKALEAVIDAYLTQLGISVEFEREEIPAELFELPPDRNDMRALRVKLHYILEPLNTKLKALFTEERTLAELLSMAHAIEGIVSVYDTLKGNMFALYRQSHLDETQTEYVYIDGDEQDEQGIMGVDDI